MHGIQALTFDSSCEQVSVGKREKEGDRERKKKERRIERPLKKFHPRPL